MSESATSVLEGGRGKEGGSWRLEGEGGKEGGSWRLKGKRKRRKEEGRKRKI